MTSTVPLTEEEAESLFVHPGMLLTDMNESTLVRIYEEPENVDDHRTHIVNPPNNQHIWRIGMSMQEVVDIARTKRLPVTALCGYTWVPKFNPEQFDACTTCLELAGDLMRGMGE